MVWFYPAGDVIFWWLQKTAVDNLYFQWHKFIFTENGFQTFKSQAGDQVVNQERHIVNQERHLRCQVWFSP